jgi:hypothetical protein
MDVTSKPLVWLHGEVKTPPFTLAARIEAGFLLRQLQEGETLDFLTLDLCPVSALTATNCESVIKTRTGTLSTELIKMQF